MQIADIIKSIELWAPTWAAWEKDNVGLQIGNPQRQVRRVLVALDITPAVIQEAIKQKAELIVSHHPLLFRPPAAITTQHPIGSLVLTLAEHHISVYSSHTNLDSVKGGVSFSLAKHLGLTKVQVLSPLRETLAKIVVFVPEGYVEQVRTAMTDAGAGIIGEYSKCSFSVAGTGSFLGSNASNPFSGTAGQMEHVREVRLELLAPRASVAVIVHAMKRSHPYEEPAYDVYPLMNPNPDFGLGAVGDLVHPVSLTQLLQKVKQKLHLRSVKYSGTATKKIRRVAVCGGAGSDLLPDALRSKADVFITADVRYHTFQSAGESLVLIDAGHYETEQVVLKPLAEHIRTAARVAGSSLSVSITKQVTNPVNIV